MSRNKTATVIMDDGRIFRDVQIVGANNASTGGLNLLLRYRSNGVITVTEANTDEIQNIELHWPGSLVPVNRGEENNITPIPEPLEGNHPVGPTGLQKILIRDVDLGKFINDSAGSMKEE